MRARVVAQLSSSDVDASLFFFFSSFGTVWWNLSQQRRSKRGERKRFADCLCHSTRSSAQVSKKKMYRDELVDELLAKDILLFCSIARLG